jgi:hypothetical protein
VCSSDLTLGKLNDRYMPWGGNPSTKVGTNMLVIKGFSSEAAVAEFCLKLEALGILTVTPVEDVAAAQVGEKLQ